MFVVRSDSRQGRQTGLTKRELATNLRVSIRAVEKWVARGCPRRLDGRFDLQSVRAWHDKTIRPRADSSSSPMLAYWRIRLEKQRALVEEHKRRAMAAALVPVDVVHQRNAEQFARAQAVLGRLPEKFASLLPKGTKAHERRQFAADVARMVGDALSALDDGATDGRAAEANQDA